MAKKTINKKVDDTKPSYWALFKAFFTNERTRFITGLVCAIVTIYIGLALISFFFTGAGCTSPPSISRPIRGLTVHLLVEVATRLASAAVFP